MRARLKHFQRLGFPPGTNTGTGKRAAYDSSAVLSICLALDLTKMQLTPEEAVALIKEHPAIFRTAREIAQAEPDAADRSLDPRFLMIEYTSLLVANLEIGARYKIAIGSLGEAVAKWNPNTDLARSSVSWLCLTYVVLALNRSLRSAGLPALYVGELPNEPNYPEMF